MGYVFATPVICYRSLPALGSAECAGVVTVLIFKSFLKVKIPGGAVYEAFPATLRNFFILYL